MKKVILSSVLMLAMAISFTSCKEAADKAKEGGEAIEKMADETADKTKEVVKETVEEVKEMAADLPSFSDSSINDYIKTYESYMSDYTKAVKDNNATALATLATKGQELSTKYQEIAGKLTSEDAQKLGKYMTEKAEAMAKLVQQ